jgi:predicted Rossmann-fold nucleotide-binding protein
MSARTRPIIAVFGSNSLLNLAEILGEKISRKAILLTGGSATAARVDVTAVKDRAIYGAIKGATRSTRWIGVDQSGRIGHSDPRSVPGFQISTDLGDQRNALEACLCDAAIALSGRDGTASEAAFTASLGKPVAFVGAGWDPYKLGTGAPHWQQMVSDGFRKVLTIHTRNAPLNLLFAQPRVVARLNASTNHHCFADPAPGAEAALADTILTWLFSPAAPVCSGAFPAMPRYAGVMADYATWLSKV